MCRVQITAQDQARVSPEIPVAHLTMSTYVKAVQLHVTCNHQDPARLSTVALSCVDDFAEAVE